MASRTGRPKPSAVEGWRPGRGIRRGNQAGPPGAGSQDAGQVSEDYFRAGQCPHQPLPPARVPGGLGRSRPASTAHQVSGRSCGFGCRGNRCTPGHQAEDFLTRTLSVIHGGRLIGPRRGRRRELRGHHPYLIVSSRRLGRRRAQQPDNRAADREREELYFVRECACGWEKNVRRAG